METQDSYKDSVKKYLSRGDIDSAVNELSDKLKSINERRISNAKRISKSKNELILLKSRIFDYNKEKRTGVLDREDVLREKSIITTSLLELLDELPDSLEEVKEKERTNTDSTSKEKEKQRQRQDLSNSHINGFSGGGSTINTNNNSNINSNIGGQGNVDFKFSSYLNLPSIKQLFKTSNNGLAYAVGFILPLTMLGAIYFFSKEDLKNKEIGVSLIIGGCTFIGVYLILLILAPEVLMDLGL